MAPPSIFVLPDRCIEGNAASPPARTNIECRGASMPPRRHINDGKPGERSVSMACMTLHRGAFDAVCRCVLLTPPPTHVVLNPRTLHRLRFTASSLSVRRTEYGRSETRDRAARDGQVHLLRRRTGRPISTLPKYAKYGANRSPKQLPDLRRECSTKSCSRATADHRRNLQGTVRSAVWLRIGHVGLENRLRDRPTG